MRAARARVLILERRELVGPELEAPRQAQKLHLVGGDFAPPAERRLRDRADRFHPRALAGRCPAVDLFQQGLDLDRDAGRLRSFLGVELEIADLPRAEIVE